MGPIGPGMVMGMLLGGLLGVVVGMLLLGRGKASTSVKVALALPSMLGGGMVGVVAGLFAGLLLDLLLIANSPLAQIFRESDQYQKLPLRRAACANDLAGVRTLLAKPLDSLSARNLGDVVIECTLSINAKVPPGDEMLKIMLPVLYARYVAGPPRIPSAKEPLKDPDYCGVLESLIGDLNAAKLRVVKSMGLPLHCRDGASHMGLYRIIGMRDSYQSRRAEFDEVMRLIGGKEGPIGQASEVPGRSFLDSVVETHDPVFIIAALEAGIDPGRPEQQTGIPAVLRWHARKFDKSVKRWPGEHTLEAGDIAAVEQLMRPPTAAEFVGSGVSILRYFDHFQQQDDGGAAYFRDLRERGVDLGLTTGGDEGILGYHRDIAPALLAELERLSPAELERMAYPRDPVSGAAGKPMLQSARDQRNWVLEAFLCRRGIGGCTPASGAPAAK